MSSWFSEIAGKAEAFLDRMDQATASTLQDAGIVKNTPKSYPRPDHALLSEDSSQSTMAVAQSLSYEPTASRRSSNPLSEKHSQGATVAQVIVGSASNSPLLLKSKSGAPFETKRESRKEFSTNPDDSGLTKEPPSSGLQTVSKTTPKVKTGKSDDILFEFLNTPSSTKARSAKTIRSTPKVNNAPPTSVNLDQQSLQQASMLPAPQLSPVKAQPSFTTSDVERSQWDAGNITTINDTHLHEVHTKGNGSHNIRGRKLEETDSPFETKNNTTPANSVADERNTEGKPPESHQEHEVSGSAPSPPLAGHSDRQTEALNVVDEALLPEVHLLRQKVSNVELENKLLKREVASLNDEMGTLMTRLNEASDSSSRYDREIQSLREQVSQSDHVIRQLRSHDDDLQALLEARDQQIVVLRTQLSEGDRTAEQLRVHVSAVQREKEQ